MKEPVQGMQDTFTEVSGIEHYYPPETRSPDLAVPPQAADAEHIRISKITEKSRTKPRIRRAEHFHAATDSGKSAILPSKKLPQEALEKNFDEHSIELLTTIDSSADSIFLIAPAICNLLQLSLADMQ